MKTLLLALTISSEKSAKRARADRALCAVTIVALLCSMLAGAQVIPAPAKRAGRVQITQGPALESAQSTSAIIRWTSNNPGGTDEHFGVVKYGTDPGQLNQTAKGHIRLNRTHDYTVFRVRLVDLKPGTTYYYTVSSTNADGTEDAVKSGTYHFTAPGGA
jgi:phosphodiesterase/alkaline phosphatase D-like protein